MTLALLQFYIRYIKNIFSTDLSHLKSDQKNIINARARVYEKLDFICLKQHNEWMCTMCNLLQQLQTQHLVNKNENRMKKWQQAQINGSNVGGTNAQKRCVKSPTSKCWKLCTVCSCVTCKSIFDLLLPSILFYPEDTARWFLKMICYFIGRATMFKDKLLIWNLRMVSHRTNDQSSFTAADKTQWLRLREKQDFY